MKLPIWSGMPRLVLMLERPEGGPMDWLNWKPLRSVSSAPNPTKSEAPMADMRL